ncbi:MAG: hypothetical protein QM820_05300 [Minicystis sp.]
MSLQQRSRQMRREDLPDHVAERVVLAGAAPDPALGAAMDQAFAPAIRADEHIVAGVDEESAQRW